MRYIYPFFYLLLLSAPAFAQEWRIVLASGHAYSDARLDSLRGDTLFVRARGNNMAIDLREITRLRRTIASGAGTGALIGAGAGVGMTLIVAMPFFKSVDREIWVKTTAAVAMPMGVLGGLIGMGIGSFDRDEEIHELSTMPMAEKAMAIEGILSQQSRDR